MGGPQGFLSPWWNKIVLLASKELFSFNLYHLVSLCYKEHIKGLTRTLPKVKFGSTKSSRFFSLGSQAKNISTSFT